MFDNGSFENIIKLKKEKKKQFSVVLPSIKHSQNFQTTRSDSIINTACRHTSIECTQHITYKTTSVSLFFR